MKALRAIALALLFSLLFGFAVGTAIRLRLEKPVVYIGMGAVGSTAPASS